MAKKGTVKKANGSGKAKGRERFVWRRKHLLELQDLSREELNHILRKNKDNLLIYLYLMTIILFLSKILIYFMRFLHKREKYQLYTHFEHFEHSKGYPELEVV